MSRRLTSADLLLVAVCVVWGTNFVVVKSALADFHPLAFNGLRFAIAATVLLGLQWRFEGLSVLRPVLPRIIVLGLVGNVAYQMLFIYGLAQTEASQASLLTATTPLWVLVLVRFSGHDKFSGRVVVGLAMGLAGVMLLLWESFNDVGSERRFWTGNLLLLGASVSWAIYTVYSQPLLRQLRPLALTSATMVAGAVPLLAMGLPEIVSIRVDEVSLASWAGLFYSALLALVFGYIGWSHGVQAIGSTRTASYVNLIPVVATATAWVWLGERLSAPQLLGATAVIAGIALSRRLNSASDQ
ncbi:MAG: EamA family transporter [Acidobacteria bacterium]|nr:EamA family transporter [Acidobacteriota bacterium]